jgi:hypothetical protein
MATRNRTSGSRGHNRGDLRPANSRGNTGRFRKGQSGNPKGRRPGVPNGATVEVRQLCLDLVARDPGYLASFRRRLREGRLKPQLEVMVWHYAFGQPQQKVLVAGDSLAELLGRQPLPEELGLPVAGLPLSSSLPGPSSAETPAAGLNHRSRTEPAGTGSPEQRTADPDSNMPGHERGGAQVPVLPYALPRRGGL